jgi:hypothetical protein
VLGCSGVLLGWFRSQGGWCYWAGLQIGGAVAQVLGSGVLLGWFRSRGGGWCYWAGLGARGWVVLLGGFSCDGVPLPKCLATVCYWAGLTVSMQTSKCWPWWCYRAGLVRTLCGANMLSPRGILCDCL